jgi:sec-independent protein translocase protein TatA
VADITSGFAAPLRSASKKERILMRLGTTELIVILLVVLIIFGPKQLPKLAKMFGKTTKAFKDGIDESDDADDKDTTAKASTSTDKKSGDDAE